MITNKLTGVPPWNEAAGGPAMTAISIETERHILRLQEEAGQWRAFARPTRPVRARLGRLIVRIGRAVAGVEPWRQAAGHRVG